MSRDKRITKPPKKRHFGLMAVVGVVVAVIAVVGVFALSSGGSDPAANSAGLAPTEGGRAGPPSATPVLPSQPLQLLGVEVARPVVDLGKVPLNTGVKGVWVMRNTGASPVSVGRPGIEVLEGC